ncbi:mechanosensitive ion channel domain-containing protein, partial [Lonsdalea quercina]
VLIVMFRPFRTGESVDLGGVSGTVAQVQIFSSTLLTPDGRIIVVPNGKIISGNIINSSREPNRRTEIIVGVAYDADIDVVKNVLGEIIKADPRIHKDKEIVIRLNEMAASSLNFVVRVWTSNADATEVYWDLLENFKRALDEHQIGIPYPQMDVHLHQTATAESADKA